MRKLFFALAATMLAATASAQERTTITSNKFGDNWYIGINGGINFTPTIQGDKATKFKGITSTAGLRLGKNLSTVLGVAFEGTAVAFSNSKSDLNSKTFLEATELNLLSTFNLSNLFSGYAGTPRNLELIALYGFGWQHQYGYSKVNAITSKAGLDLALNLGADKAWQIYLEPAAVWDMKSWGTPNAEFKYNLNKVDLRVNVGVNYKFGNSNGTHNFKVEALRNQAEIDQLQASINALRADNQAKEGQLNQANRDIEDLKKQLADCQNRKPTEVEKVVVKNKTALQPIVIFGQGKSTIDAAQYASVEMVAKYMRNHKDSKVLVKGYASPEGNAELNQKLSEKRAESVKDALVKRYKIDASRITTQGLGATSDISEENDFNRVAMFFDTTVQ